MLENGTREETLELLTQSVFPQPCAQVPPHKAAGLVLAETVRSPADIPEHARSSRDGYALNSADTADAPLSLPVTATFAPGDLPGAITARSAARILTGAPVPRGADAVVMDEDVHREGDTLLLSDRLVSGEYIFPAGSDLAHNATVAEPGTTVTPGLAGVLTRCGVEGVAVHPAPEAAVLALGNELVAPGATPDPGGFRSDNLVLATALLESAGATVNRARTVQDTPEAMREALSDLPGHGLTVTMGGTGRGDHDLARSAARQAGFEIIVDGVRLRPGRTMFAARRDDSLLLGLPGPPFAVAPLLYAFALPLLRIFAGHQPAAPRTARLNRPLRTRKGLEWLAPCTLDWSGPILSATPLADHALSPLEEIARLHAYIAVPPETSLAPGTDVPLLAPASLPSL